MELKKESLVIILITGGATDLEKTFVRMWPVDAVISESGLSVNYEEGPLKRTLSPMETIIQIKDQYVRLFNIVFVNKIISICDEEKDNPMFGFFEPCVKVNPKIDYGSLIKQLLEFITKDFGGGGFAKAVEEIQKKRNN